MKHIIYNIAGMQEVTELNVSLLDVRDHEFHWSKPWNLTNADGMPYERGKPSDIKVFAIKYPVTDKNGILIKDSENSQLEEIGYNSLYPENLEEIRNNLPRCEARLS